MGITRPVGRRSLIGGAVGLAAAGATTVGVANGVLPGRSRLYSALDAVLPVPSPAYGPGPVRTGSFVSAARRGTRVGWVVAYPPDSPTDPLPVVLALHGQGDDASVVTGLRLPGFLADAVAAGSPPFAIAAADGGRGYWHARRDGEDAQSMLLREFMPLLAGLPRTAGSPALAAGPWDRVGLLGWSAGGFGALLLAERLGSDRVSAVSAASPALWISAADTVEGAFDDAADHARHDVFAGRDRLRGVVVRVDCGLGDPFLEATQAFTDGLLPAPVTSWGAGAHDDAYWRRLVPDQLRFLGHGFNG